MTPDGTLMAHVYAELDRILPEGVQPLTFTPNFRFWVWWNGYVKLTVPGTGEKVTLHSYVPDEEGYSDHTEEYWYEDGHIVCESTTHARDCDGPLDRYCTVKASVVELDVFQPKAWEIDLRGRLRETKLVPKWESVEASQRDHYAEAMGY